MAIGRRGVACFSVTDHYCTYIQSFALAHWTRLRRCLRAHALVRRVGYDLTWRSSREGFDQARKLPVCLAASRGQSRCKLTPRGPGRIAAGLGHGTLPR